MFLLQNGVVRLARYKIESEDPFDKLLVTEYAESDEHRDSIVDSLGETELTVTEIEQTDNEWIDGMKFDNWEAANAAFIMGQTAYLNSKPVMVEEQLAALTFALVEGGVI